MQKRSLLRRGRGPFFTSSEIEKICRWIKGQGLNPKMLMCHGARNGMECDEFVKHFPSLKAYGTDLFPYSGSGRKSEGSKIFERDFSVRRKSWLSTFDIVYSNSLDHARNPFHTLRVWLKQLTPSGFLFIQWTQAHAGVGGGDCFGSGLFEHIKIGNSVGNVVDLLYTRIDNRTKETLTIPKSARKGFTRRARETVVLVIERKNK
jgi:hypothetical protein